MEVAIYRLARHSAYLASFILAIPSANADDAPVSQQAEHEIHQVGSQEFAVDWLFDEAFDSNDWSTRWTVESQGPSVFVEQGELSIRREDSPKDQAGVTVWFNQDLPQNVIIIVDASTEPGDHACNLNFFVHAKELGNKPLEYKRTGAYKSYHEITNYLFTFTGGFMSGWTRARINPGFKLISEDESVYAEPGSSYELTIVCDRGDLSFYIDGELKHHFQEEALPGGRFGLRTWFSDVNYDRIRIGALANEKERL
ncbi:DUF6250 domain-containing protein [Cerasicoccus maritimus]|uniref:DUF6250 domain-containing protein n=1 Tax=Cerasicoccus maritimus TaxID=490089 RepID=UPI0028529D13|nr:DUF6250 domain-containing protein [Cerasicoccus maritimus]